MEIKTTRKCKQCKLEIVLENKASVYFKKSHFHDECFISMLLSKKKNPPTRETAIAILNQLKLESNIVISEMITKNHLYKWLQKSYDLAIIPGFFFQRLEEVYQGSYKGLSEAISPTDVYYIWRHKKDKFDQINNYQSKKGKNIVGVSRLAYDLAIVISEYDSYKKWKEKQEVDKKIICELIGQEKIDYDKIFVKPDREDDYIIDDNEEECKINE